MSDYVWVVDRYMDAIRRKTQKAYAAESKYRIVAPKAFATEQEAARYLIERAKGDIRSARLQWSNAKARLERLLKKYGAKACRPQEAPTK